MADKNPVGRNEYSIAGPLGANTLVERPVIRPANFTDVPDILAIAQSIEGDKGGTTREWIEQNLNTYYVEGIPLHGLIRMEPMLDYLLVTQLAVKPEFQRTGVATRLLEAANLIAQMAGLTSVKNMGPKTPEITRLYDKLGYVEEARIPDGWGKGEDAIVLSKEVNNE